MDMLLAALDVAICIIFMTEKTQKVKNGKIETDEWGI